MEKKNLLLVFGIMIVLVVAIFGIVMFSSGEKDADNPSKEIKFMENKCDGNCSSTNGGGGSIKDGGAPNSKNAREYISNKLMKNGQDLGTADIEVNSVSSENFGEMLIDETEEENSKSEDKITEA